jgi:hypothetical protein
VKLTNRERVVNRMTPCTCGCHGQDPWHLRYYKRVVTQHSATRGTVTLPGCTKSVVVNRRYYPHFNTDGSLCYAAYGSWIVDPSTKVWK